MKEFRTKEMSIKICCACVNDEYFSNKLRDYYCFLSCSIPYSKKHGYYRKTFYKLKSFYELSDLGCNTIEYSELPTFVCASEIY